MRIRLIVLPGTDGTGALSDAFVAACRATVTVPAYPPDRALGYAALVEHLRRQLPTSEPFVLLGESFGGPLAVMLAASRPAGLRGIVLCASFARLPFAALRVPRPRCAGRRCMACQTRCCRGGCSDAGRRRIGVRACAMH